jgi:hypothetical protein
VAATVVIVEKNGAGGTATDKTSGTIRFKNADDKEVDTNDRLVVPVSGSDYSYEKWLRFRVDVAPSVDLANLKFYTDGANGFGTGISLYAKAVTNYSTPAEATSTTGYADAFTYTSSAPLSLGAGPFTSTGEKGDHCVLMLKVDSTAAPGLLSTESLVFQFDET